VYKCENCVDKINLNVMYYVRMWLRYVHISVHVVRVLCVQLVALLFDFLFNLVKIVIEIILQYCDVHAIGIWRLFTTVAIATRQYGMC
jgi:hypothetical protein